MRKLLWLLPLTAVCFFVSCEKCIRCSAHRGPDDNKVVVIPEEKTCGKTREVRLAEANFDEDCNYEKAMDPGTVCGCEEEE